MKIDHIQNSKHLPALDGLRGIAILGVLSCHLVKLIPGQSDPVSRFINSFTSKGWMGVDLFFVLSGFLITGILLDTKVRPGYFMNFYGRRTLRIFPLYYFYLFAFTGLFLIYYFMSHGDAKAANSLRDSLWAFPYLTNVEVALHGHKATSMLNHFWSLCVEEQFYLLWPTVVWFATRRQLTAVCFILIILAFVFRLFCWRHGIDGDYLMPCRADSLAVGGLLAILCRNDFFIEKFKTIPSFTLLFCAVPAVICFNLDLGPNFWNLLISSALAVAFGALLLISVASDERSPIGKMFCLPLLRSFGKYSYGLYVWNQPIAFFPGIDSVHDRLLQIVKSPLAATLIDAGVRFGLSFLCAWASWHLMEKHFLKMKSRFT